MSRFRILGLLALLGAAFAAAALALPHSPEQLRTLILAAGLAAPAIAVVAWIVLTPALVSGTLLAGAAGLAFGAPAGAALSFLGAVLGGLAAFALARTLARERVEEMVTKSPRLSRLHGMVERRGFQAVLAARLMPGMPATGLHYAAGIAPVRTRAFTAAIAVGALLRTTPYALLGGGLAAGSLVAVGVAVASIALGGLGAAVLFRQVRRDGALAPG
jgi:uncharacterized membrane protein YdjX (TVP38/TMEM64 family)